MDKEELEIMIPSETVRKHIMETGWTFTDREKAALMYHRDQLWKEECALLKSLADRTGDEELRGQIAEWIEWHEKALRLFKENNERQHIYILNVKEEGGYWDGEYLPCGYFFNWEEAYAYGKKENAPFDIEKYKVGDVSEFDDGTCSHHSESDVRFDEDGEIRFISSGEIPDVLDSYEETRDHFSEMYFEVPNPFDRGDIVRSCRDGGYYGIVGMSQERWKKKVARCKGEMAGYADYSDIKIGVDFFNEKTGFFFPTDDVSPLDLERYERKDKGLSGTIDTLLLAAEVIYREEGYIGDYFYWLEQYQEAVKSK